MSALSPAGRSRCLRPCVHVGRVPAAQQPQPGLPTVDVVANRQAWILDSHNIPVDPIDRRAFTSPILIGHVWMPLPVRVPRCLP
jgi:hypothetical protein